MLGQYLAKYWNPLQDNITELLNPEDVPPLAAEMIKYQIGSGGKRIRPVLAIMVQEALDQKVEEIFPFAAAVELIHNAALVHDDLQDGDDTRRGRPTVWKVYSAEQAINLGDMLFILSFFLFDRLNLSDSRKLSVVRIATRAVSDLVSGQVLEFYLRNQEHFSDQDYVSLAERKTGSLFTLALSGAAVVAGAEQDVEDALGEIGRKLGVLFQIRDDIIDALGTKEGRELGSDIAEGKITMLLVHYLASSAEKEEQKGVLEILRATRDETQKADIHHVLKCLKRAGSYGYTLDYAYRLKAEILDSPILIRLLPLKEKLSLVLDELMTGLPDSEDTIALNI